MRQLEHPDDSLLIGYLDGELPDEEFLRVRSHLSSCGECRGRQEEFTMLSSSVQSMIARTNVPASDVLREKLSSLVLARKGVSAKRETPAKVMRRFGWGMAAAAALAFGLLLMPHREQVVNHSSGNANSIQESGLISINGENFISVPYSNPDLPLSAPRIVEMRVPVSSLASAGIVLEPISGSTDRTVLANVLLGLDGQPRGVHVLSEE